MYQLLEQYSATEKGNPQTYRATKKVHVLYLEHLSFVIKQAGWHVTKIYSH